MSGLIFLVIVIGVAVLFGLWAVGIYNGLIVARNAFKNAFAQIDVQLQRRFDLIPNLVETVKGYLAHERGTLEAVVAARGAAVSGLSAASANPGDPAAMAELAQAQGVLNGMIGRLLAVVEAYPDLKANQNMMQLTEELTVLDLYAGSGALGLEALSRGASRVEFVELNPPSLAALRENIAALGVEARVAVHRGDALRFAGRLAPGAYDLALADPPYTRDDAAALVTLFRRTPFARILAVEHPAKTAVPGDDTRRYGDTAITFCHAP